MKGPQKAPIRHRLPADSHVHSEFSWDGGSDPAAPGRLRRTCEQAVRIGVPAVVFTEHLDLAESWWAEPADLGEHAGRYVGADGYARLPGFDLEGYLAEIEHCRADFPGLRILTGIEYGQPHLHDDASDALRRGGRFDRVNGSLHTLPFPESPGGGSADRTEPTTLYRFRPAADVMTAYLEELPRMITGSDTFEVLTHIDYAVRSWPAAAAGPFDPHAFEEGFRAAMRALAESGRALELNTRRLWPWIPQWWREEGGHAVTFGSDAHTPGSLAAHFPEAAAMAESCGFGPGRRAEDFWTD